MTLARDLARQGHRVTLCEAAQEIGGLAGAWRLGDITWDRHYHVTLLSDMSLRALLRDLELEEELQWTQTRTGFFSDGQLYSMSNSIEFLRFPPLGLIGKLRLAFTILYASRITDWQSLENIPVTEWLAKWSGRKTFEKIWLPLLRSKLGDNYTKASASFIWATIRRLYAARREGLKKEMFGYVPGGYGRVLGRFRDLLEHEGVEIHLGAAALDVQKTCTGAIRVRLSSGATEEFDQVVLTMAAPIAARICPDLSEEERSLLEGVEYQGIVCASLLLKKPLAGYYVTNITDPDVLFTGVIEMSALVDRAEFGGNSLVYLPKYLPSADPAFALSDAEWRESFLAGLRRVYRDFHPDDVLTFQLSRVKYVFAIPTLGYSKKLPPVHTSIPGLHIWNSAHIVNGTLNVNETIELAHRGAEMFRNRSTPGRPVEHDCEPVAGLG